MYFIREIYYKRSGSGMTKKNNIVPYIYNAAIRFERGMRAYYLGDLDQAIQYMSKRRIGALITIQQNTGLEDYIETGISLDADVTGALLINIFIPNTPLHDGAVIIKDNKIAVAAAYLPLSESNLIPKELGTRHRAAVGISEVTDALTIVVSEETGGVTVTKNNELIRDLTQQDYLKLLRNELVPRQEEVKTNPVTRFIEGMIKGGGHKH